MLNVGQNNPRTKIRRKSRTTLSENNDSTYNKSRRQSAQASEEVTEPARTPVTFDNFSHIIYEKAAIIFAYLKGEPDSLLPTFGDERVKRRSYSLAFGAKKYESVLNDILLDSYFFSSYFKLEAYYRNHVMVMLLDYQQNDFQFGVSGKRKHVANSENIFPHVAEIQEALESFYVKLRASLARNRIREYALSVEDLLPTEEKEKNEYVCHQPIYAYVNSLKTCIDDVVDVLVESGFLKVNDVFDYSEFSGHHFAIDVHLKDLIVFPRDVKYDVYNHDLVQSGFLVVQDKSRCLAPEVVRSVLLQVTLAKEKAASLIPGEIRPVFTDGDDVIVVHSDSVNIIARMSAFVHPERSLFVFGVKSKHQEELRSMLDRLGVRNVTLLEENFLDALPNDERFRKVRVVLYNAQCSKSGVISPIDFVLQEGAGCVYDLVNGIQSNKLRGLVMKHQENLKHVMKFHFVQHIVYFTSSIHNSENEDVVKDVIEEYNVENLSKNKPNPFGVVSFMPDLTENLKNFKTNPAKATDVLPGPEYTGFEKYLKLNGRMGLNGGFVCLLQRQKLVDSANDVLERAAKKGLMKGTKRGKKPPSSKASKLSNEKPKRGDKYFVEKQQLEEVPKRLEKLVVKTRDEEESKVDLDIKEKETELDLKNNETRPFYF